MAKFERLAALTLGAGETLRATVLDESAGLAYIAVKTASSVVVRKVQLSNLAVLGSGTLTITQPAFGLIDTVAQFAYFFSSTGSAPDVISKFNLATMTEDATLPLPANGRDPLAGAIDVAGGFFYVGYFDNGTVQAKVSKVSLSSFTISTSQVYAGTTLMLAMSIDTTTGHIYFTEGVHVRKIQTSDLSLVLTGNTTGSAIAVLVDPPNSKVYVGTDGDIVQRFPTGTLVTDGTINFMDSFAVMWLKLHVSSARLYAGRANNVSGPMTIKKIATATFTELNTATMNAGEFLFNSTFALGGAAVDQTDVKLFAATSTSPGKLLKVDIPLTESKDENIKGVCSVHFPEVEERVGGGINLVDDLRYNLFQRVRGFAFAEGVTPTVTLLDGNGFAYVATDESPSVVHKIRLGDMSIVTSETLSVNLVRCGVIDPVAGFAYFGTDSPVPAMVSKLNINSMVEVNAISLGVNTQLCRGAQIDVSGGFAYFIYIDSGSGDSVAKINLTSFTVQTVLSGFNAGNVSTCALDVANARLYVGGGNTNIIRINTVSMLANGGGTIGSGSCASMVVDSSTNKLYVGTNDNRLLKFSTAVVSLDATINYADVPKALVLDVPNQRLYAAFPASSPLNIVKVRCSDFVEIRNAVMNSGENGTRSQWTGTLDGVNHILYWTTQASSPAEFLEIAAPNPEELDESIAGSSIIAAEVDSSVAGKLIVNFGLADSFAGKTILSIPTQDSMAGYVQLDMYTQSRIGGLIKLTRFADESIGGQVIVAAIKTEKVAGKTIVAQPLTDLIDGEITVVAFTTDYLGGSILLEDPPGTAIKGKTTLETTLLSMIGGTVIVRPSLMEPITIYKE